MNSLRSKFIENPEIYMGNSATFRVLGEFKGRQDILLESDPDSLGTLKKLAMIEGR